MSRDLSSSTPQTVLLFRHGIAEPSGPNWPDDALRPLTEKGRRRVVEVASGIATLGIEPVRIVTSPAVRARTTAELLVSTLGWDDRLEVSEQLAPNRQATAMSAWVRLQPDRILMLVGHNDALSDLIMHLTCPPDEPPNLPELAIKIGKAGLAMLKRIPESTERYRLYWLISPRQLSRMSR